MADQSVTALQLQQLHGERALHELLDVAEACGDCRGHFGLTCSLHFALLDPLQRKLDELHERLIAAVTALELERRRRSGVSSTRLNGTGPAGMG